MAEKVQFELVSPEKLLLSQAVDMVVVPGGEGDFGALPRHAPMISVLRPGVIDVHNGGKVAERIFVAGGFAEVNEERCTVLAEEAIPVAELKADAVEARLSDAKAALAGAKSEAEKGAALKAVSVAEAMKAAL